MPIQLLEENDGKILGIHISGKLVKENYAGFAPKRLAGILHACLILVPAFI